jgi:hypothetical protein
MTGSGIRPLRRLGHSRDERALDNRERVVARISALPAMRLRRSGSKYRYQLRVRDFWGQPSHILMFKTDQDDKRCSSSFVPLAKSNLRLIFRGRFMFRTPTPSAGRSPQKLRHYYLFCHWAQ